MRAVEQANAAIARHRFVGAPEEVVGRFFGRRRFEVGGLHTGGRDKFEHAGACAVLAAAVHALEQYDQRVGCVGVELVLQLANPLAKLACFLACFRFLQAAAIVRVEFAQADAGGDLDGLGQRFEPGSRVRYCSRSIFAARTKSLSVRPSILWVQIVTLTRPQVR